MTRSPWFVALKSMDLLVRGKGSLWRAGVLGGALLAVPGCGGRVSQATDHAPAGTSLAGSGSSAGNNSLAGAGAPTASGSGGESPNDIAGAPSFGGSSAGGSAAEPTRVTDVAGLSATCDPSLIHPGPSPLRRLTRIEYDNTVRDLTGLTASPTTGLPFSHEFPPEPLGPFSNDAQSQPANTEYAAAAYEKAAQEIAASVAPNAETRFSGCDSATMDETTCAKAFLESFGKHAFRRPLTDEELARYQGVLMDVSSGATHQQRVALVVSSMLQSDNFLTRVEVGVPTSGASAIALTPYELATRLSYFLWNSMPDEELFAAADANALSTVEQLTAQAKRMLASPMAAAAARQFHREWLAWDGVVEADKTSPDFPDWTPRLAEDMLNEALRFGDDVFWNDGRLTTLLSAPYSFMNGALATHYGLPSSGGSAFVRVALDPKQRSGILTLGAFLATYAGRSQTNPVTRGDFIRSRLLCDPVPPEPPTLSVEPALTVPPGLTRRQRLEQFHSISVCRVCHAKIDPLGFGLENFDAVGNWRTKDGDAPIDASGTIIGAIDPATNGPFNGPIELSQKLASSGDVRACVAAQWFRWANGRSESLPEDACSLLAINQRFQASGYDMRVLPLAIIATDAFRYRSAEAKSVP